MLIMFAQDSTMEFNRPAFFNKAGDLVLCQEEYEVSHGVTWCLAAGYIGRRIGFFQFIK